MDNQGNQLDKLEPLEVMPLRTAVVEVTHEALGDDPEAVRRAVRSWHNRLACGSIPRSLVMRLGRDLFLDLGEWNRWVLSRKEVPKRRGRPRSEY
jgi:hypothetical protein